MSAEGLPAELVTLIEVIADGGTLGTWFEQLSGVSESAPLAALQRVAMEMEAGGEDAAAVDAVRMLAHPQIYHGACVALEVARGKR